MNHGLVRGAGAGGLPCPALAGPARAQGAPSPGVSDPRAILESLDRVVVWAAERMGEARALAETRGRTERGALLFVQREGRSVHVVARPGAP